MAMDVQIDSGMKLLHKTTGFLCAFRKSDVNKARKCFSMYSWDSRLYNTVQNSILIMDHTTAKVNPQNFPTFTKSDFER
jgi:hypothetical protein